MAPAQSYPQITQISADYHKDHIYPQITQIFKLEAQSSKLSTDFADYTD